MRRGSVLPAPRPLWPPALEAPFSIRAVRGFRPMAAHSTFATSPGLIALLVVLGSVARPGIHRGRQGGVFLILEDANLDLKNPFCKPELCRAFI